MGGTIGIYGVIADDTITIDKSKGPYNFNLFVHQWPTRHREAAAQRPLCEWIRQGHSEGRGFHHARVPRRTDRRRAGMPFGSGEVIKALLRY